MIMKGSSVPSKVESKNERSRTRFKVASESVTSIVNSNEPNPESGSTLVIVSPVAIYSKSKELPSTSTDIVSAYTNAEDSIVKKINPREIFSKVFPLAKFLNLSDCNWLIL